MLMISSLLVHGLPALLNSFLVHRFSMKIQLLQWAWFLTTLCHHAFGLWNRSTCNQRRFVNADMHKQQKGSVESFTLSERRGIFCVEGSGIRTTQDFASRLWTAVRVRKVWAHRPRCPCTGKQNQKLYKLGLLRTRLSDSWTMGRSSTGWWRVLHIDCKWLADNKLSL